MGGYVWFYKGVDVLYEIVLSFIQLLGSQKLYLIGNKFGRLEGCLVRFVKPLRDKFLSDVLRGEIQIVVPQNKELISGNKPNLHLY